MTLYKYIDMKNCHWSFPLISRKLHFSSLDEIRSVNDTGELNHLWDHPSYFFTTNSHYFSAPYNNLFNGCKILCLGKSLTKECWHEFIKSDKGVCYEFSYTKLQNGITSDHIIYDDSKAFNVPNYILNNLKNSFIKKILEANKWSYQDRLTIYLYLMTTRQMNELFEDHIYKEMVMKKTKKYLHEDEYRFIHPEKPFGPQILKVNLQDSKATFNDLGLKLDRIYTNAADKVMEHINSNEAEVLSPPFKI